MNFHHNFLLYQALCHSSFTDLHTMKILPEVILAYSFVLGSFYLIYQIIPTAVPVSVQLVDSAYNADADPRFLCWISPDENINLHELANSAHNSCSKLDPGFISSTYVGHRFLLVNADRTISDPPTIVTAQSSINYVDVAHYSNYDTRDNFDIVVEWQNLLLQRRRIATAVALAMLILLMFSRTGTIHNQAIAPKQLTTKFSINEPLIERHAIKAYAVLSMVLNHCGYTLVRRNLQLQTWLTLLADAGGSMALFHWLVGYNTSPSSKNSDALILAVFIFLQLAVDHHLRDPAQHCGYPLGSAIQHVPYLCVDKHMRSCECEYFSTCGSHQRAVRGGPRGWHGGPQAGQHLRRALRS